MEEFKFTVQHVPTGRSIEITYKPKYRAGRERGRSLPDKERTMKLTFALLVIAVVRALPLAAATLDTTKFAQATGVRIDGGAKVNIAEGQTLTAKVVNPATLAKLG